MGLGKDTFSTICGTFLFLEKPDEKFNLGHLSYLFKMWIQDLATEKVIEKHLGLFQIKEHYERQYLDPPAELLADLLLNEEIQTLRPNLDLSKSF